jgi:hypothetical protein
MHNVYHTLNSVRILKSRCVKRGADRRLDEERNVNAVMNLRVA